MRKRMKTVAAMMICMILVGASGGSAATYAYGNRADEVALIQEALTELGFYYADVTGHYGKKTERAVQLFQRRHRIAQTGVCDAHTFSRILAEADMEAPKIDEEEPQRLGGILRQGDSSSAVRLLQEQLTELGFYHGTITGRFGGLTKEAVRLFQRAHELSSDGIAGPRTLEKLAQEMGDEEEPWHGDVQDGEDDGEEEEQTTVVALSGVGTLNTEITLRRGSRSGYVRRLQNALTALGYFDGKTDGVFGAQTEEAVRTYQTARDLTVDGIAGRATLRKINEDVKNGVTIKSEPID